MFCFGTPQTPGQFRDMTADEKKRAPGGSFTCVEISKLKRQYINLDREILKTKCLLADIYYDYIHVSCVLNLHLELLFLAVFLVD